MPSVYTPGLARACCAPLRTPGLSRRCRAPDDRGLRPRTPAPVRARRSGAPLWSPPTSPWRSRSPSTRPRRPSGSPMPGSAPAGRERRPRAVARPLPASPSRTAPPTEAPLASAGTRRRRGRTSRRDASRRRRGLGATPNHE